MKIITNYLKKRKFRRCVAAEPCGVLRTLTKYHDFPGPDYREVKLFINKHRIYWNTAECLLSLYEKFHTDKALVKQTA